MKYAYDLSTLKVLQKKIVKIQNFSYKINKLL